MQADLDKSALRRSLIAARKALSAEDKIQSVSGSVGSTFTFGAAHDYISAQATFKHK